MLTLVVISLVFEFELCIISQPNELRLCEPLMSSWSDFGVTYSFNSIFINPGEIKAKSECGNKFIW